MSSQGLLAPATHLPNLVGSICARTETVAAFHMIRQSACRRCHASFDNTHMPHLVSLPNQQLARRLVWHSGCFSKNCEGENREQRLTPCSQA